MHVSSASACPVRMHTRNSVSDSLSRTSHAAPCFARAAALCGDACAFPDYVLLRPGTAS